MTQPPPDSPKPKRSERLESLETPQKSVFSGARWHSMSSSFVQLARLFITIVLANQLGPEVFGLMAAVQVIVGFADYFKDAGIGQAIVRRPQLEPGFLSTMFYTNLALGAFISAVLWFSAPTLASLINEPEEAVQVLQVLGLSVFITATGVVQRSVYARVMRFDRLALANILNGLTYGAVAIVLAYLGYGIWAMVWGVIVGHVFGNGILWFQVQWLPSRRYSFAFVRDIWVFSVGVLGSNLSNNFLNNIDRMVVQIVLGSKALGSYAIAARLVTFPARNLGRALTSVMLPAFSRLQGDLALYRQSLLRSCAGVALVTCPIMLGLMAVAPTLVEALFHDPEWRAAIPLIIYMGPLGIVLSVSLPLSAVYVSLGRSMQLFLYGLVFGIISLQAYLIGSLHGVVGVAISGTLMHTLMSYFYFAVPFRYVHLSVGQLLRTIAPYLWVSTVMGAAVWGLRIGLEAAHWHPLAILVVCVAVGVLLYGGVMLWLNTGAVRDLKRFIGWDKLMKHLGARRHPGGPASGDVGA